MSMIVTGIVLMLTSGLMMSLTFGYKPKLIEKSVLLPMLNNNKLVRVFMGILFFVGIFRVMNGIQVI